MTQAPRASKQPDGARLSYESSGSRQVRPTALGRGTHGVPDVRRLVEDQFHVGFPHRVWIAGLVSLPMGDDAGTLRFMLTAATGDEPFALPCAVPADTLPAVCELLQRTHDAVLEDVVREGRLARAGGLLRFDAARNCVTFVVSELDPTPTAAELTVARERALQAVADAGLPGRQRGVPYRLAPVRIAVLGGTGDPSLAEAERALKRSGGARVHVAPVPLHGVDASTRLAQAVRSAAADNDVVLLVRAAGRPLGLASYDGLEVAQAVADAPVPVATGLGGAGTRTACDEVAYASLPTAAAAATWVLGRLDDADRLLTELGEDIEREAADAAARCRAALETARTQVEQTGDEAAVRSAELRRRARLRLRVAAGVLAVLVAVAAAVLGAPLMLLGLLAVLALVVGVELWWSGGRTRGSGRMAQADDDFAQVVERLEAVRDELSTASSPERVGALREQATQLVTRGRELLGRHLPTAPPAAEQPAAAETAALPLGEGGASAGWVQPDAVPTPVPDPAAPADAVEPERAAQPAT